LEFTLSDQWFAVFASRKLGLRHDPGPDAGIDLVAETTEGEFHAIQAKFYDEEATVNLETFGTFFTASSKKHFSRRLVFLTATRATTHLQEAWREQEPPVTPGLIGSNDYRPA
jgi:predicted helicase